MIDEKSLLIYKGEFNGNIIDILLSNVKRRINNDISDLKNRKRFYHIAVECIENLNRHARLNLDGEKINDFTSLFFLQKSNDALTTITGNLISKSVKDNLRESLDNVISLNVDELKNLYRNQLLVGKISDKGGAGVGLYDIAIKSNNNLSYQFYPVNDNVFFYLLKIEIKLN